MPALTQELFFAALALIAVLVAGNLVAWLLFKASVWGVTHAGRVAGQARHRARRLGFIQTIQQRWPRSSAFVAGRFDAKHFSGLPLTLLVIAAFYMVFLIGGIVEELYESEELLVADQRISALLDPLRTPEMVTIFAWITKFGNQETLTAVTIAVAAMLWAHGPRRFILPFWVAVIGAQVVSWSGKFYFSRPRPEFLFDVTAHSPSFPSGHAAGSVSTFLLLAYILARDLPTRWQRVQIVYWLGALAALICLSRVFIGVHYPSDVAAGALLGAFWIAVAVALSELRFQDNSAGAGTS